MIVRAAVETDYPAAMKLIADFTEESLGEFGTYLDPKQLQKTYDSAWRTSFAAVEEGEVIGMLAGRVTEDICSTLPVYEELVWFMRKDKRKYGITLFRFLEGWCRSQNIHRITMSCMHNSKTDKLFSLYGKLGFQPMETRFIKQLD